MTHATHKIAAFALSALVFATGCVAEDWSNCPPATPPTAVVEEVLVVRVTDILSGADLTDAGRVVDASLMVFDANQQFVERVEVPAADIGQEIEIPLPAYTRAAGGEFHISAWGNIAGNIDIQKSINVGDPITSQFLSLKPSLTYSDNMTCPGEMFFGLKKITLGSGDYTVTRGSSEGAGAVAENATADTIKIVHIVPITQRTARMAITVRGLPAGATADQYYFSLCEQNDGFSFEGTPLQNDMMCKIREQGVFNSAHEYVSPEPYWVIPSIDPENPHGCHAGVCLYKVGSGANSGGGATRADSGDPGFVDENGDINLSGKATVDVEGNRIVLLAGQTTNVLITFSPVGDVSVEVKMTPWNEVYQWTTWR